MQTIILTIHCLLALALIGVVLMQRSEGGGLGIGGGGGNMGNFMTARGTANLLTRITAILAIGFFCTSMALALLAGGNNAPRSLLDSLPDTPAVAPPVEEDAAVPVTPPTPESAPAPQVPTSQ